MEATDILAKAEGHMRDRAATYDKPEGERSMARTVAAFNAIHGTSLTVAQGWSFMAVLKHVRLFTGGEYHADSCEDMAAYVALMGEEMSESVFGPDDLAFIKEDSQRATKTHDTIMANITPAERPLQIGDRVIVTVMPPFGTHGEIVGEGVEAGMERKLLVRIAGGQEILAPLSWLTRDERPQEDTPYVDPYDQPARG